MKILNKVIAVFIAAIILPIVFTGVGALSREGAMYGFVMGVVATFVVGTILGLGSLMFYLWNKED